MTFARVWAALVEQWYPNDPFKHVDATRQYYETKWDIARRLGPGSILEIGVRSGYSAYVFLSAVRSDAIYLGIDSGLCDAESGNAYLDHARRLLVGRKATLWVTQAQALHAWPNPPPGFPLWDLIHVDADHGYEGCLHDLRLSAAIGRWILVDDYDTGAEIRQACETLQSEQPGRWVPEHFGDGGLAGNLLLARAGS